MPIKNSVNLTLNKNDEVVKQAELRANAGVQGESLRAIILRDLARYYELIAEGRKHALEMFSDEKLKKIELDIIECRNEGLSFDKYIANKLKVNMTRGSDKSFLLSFQFTAFALMDAFEFMEAKGYKNLKEAMQALEGK